MELIPIRETVEENPGLAADPRYRDNLQMCVDFYKKVGFKPPWICYVVEEGGEIIASAAYKGAPVNGRVEIAYGTDERFRRRGIGSQVCRMLVTLALETDPDVVITARTLPERNYSARILERNNFECTGPVFDKEDGEVWEWVYKGPAVTGSHSITD